MIYLAYVRMYGIAPTLGAEKALREIQKCFFNAFGRKLKKENIDQAWRGRSCEAGGKRAFRKHLDSELCELLVSQEK